MTTPLPDRPRGPAGMPAHLWDLACSDVRTSVPERIRTAVANGMNAPEGVRRIAARVAAVGAAVGIPAALIGIGATAEGFATSDAPVDLAGGEAPLDALDPVPPQPGSESADHGPTVGVGPDGGYASQTTSGTGDVGAGMGTTWHVQEPGAEPGEWLTVQMFQDVTVTETADGMFVVDAYQYIVIRDDDGNEYVFTEHYQVIVPDPPGHETDLVIHERGFVHVVENPDGSFRIDSTDHGIDVTVTSDGDGRDEVGITQTQGVKVTDSDRTDGTDVTVDLNEKAISTSDDTGDEATTTIEQDQVFTDGDLPPDPFGEQAAGRQTAGSPTPVSAGNPGAAPSGSPAAGSAGGAGGSAAGTTSARVVESAPLSSTIAVSTPVAATTTWQAQPAAPDVRPVDQATPAPAGPDAPADVASSPFAGGKTPTEQGPFDPGTTPGQGTGTPGPDGTGTGGADTDTGPDGGTANAGPPEHETTVDQTPDDTTPVEHTATERTDDQADGDAAQPGTGGDGADHALVS